jgi:hypothetical protein
MGGMNPSLHYPIWYRYKDLINEEEEKYALEVGHAMLLPPPDPFAMFDTGVFQVRCYTNRWEILTYQPDNNRRILHVAERLFDELLPHTPVPEFRLSFSLSFDLRQAETDVGEILKQLANSIHLEFGLSDPSLAELAVTERREAFTLHVRVRVGEDNLTLAVTSQARFISSSRATKGEILYYSLKETLEPHFDKLQDEAEKRAESVSGKFLSR